MKGRRVVGGMMVFHWPTGLFVKSIPLGVDNSIEPVTRQERSDQMGLERSGYCPKPVRDRQRVVISKEVTTRFFYAPNTLAAGSSRKPVSVHANWPVFTPIGQCSRKSVGGRFPPGPG